MKIDTGHTGSEADDASSDNRPLKNPRELPQDTPPNWEELSGIATPEADYQLRHYTLKEYIQPKQPVRTLLGAILGGWDPMAVPVYPYLEQFGVEQFIRTRRIIWGLICEEEVQDDGVPPIATPFPLPLDLIHQSWVDITRAFASGHSRSTIGHLDKPHGRFEVTSVFLHDYIGLEHSILTHIDRALYRLMVETYSLGSSGTMRKILYTCVLKAVYEAPQGIVSFEPRAQVSNRIVEFIIASSYTNPLIPLVQYAVQIHDPEEPMIDGKVVAHHPFLSNEAQLRLAAARDRRDADYADAIVDRRPIRSARTRAIPDSPRSAGVASLIYPEPEMIRRAAAKAMDPINQRLSLIVPPTAVGGTCDPLRAAIIRLMPHDHSRGVHLQVQNDLRVEDWRAKVKTQRAAEAPAWTRGHVAKESMASSAPTVLNTPPAVRPERHVTWSPYVAEDARQVKRHAALAALAISQAAAHPNAMTGSTATPSHAADTDTLSSDFGKIGIRDMAQTLPTGLTTAFTTPPRQSGQIREETARRSPSQFALDLAVATVRMPKRAVELIGSIVVQTAEPVGRLALRQARRIAAPSSPSSSQMLLGVAVDQQSPPAADTDRPVIVLNDSPKMHYTARWLLMTRPGFSSPESPVPAVSLPIEELAYHAQRWLAERHVKDIFRRLWDVSPSACLMHLAIVDLIECRTFYQCIRTRDEVRVALDIALAEVMFGILRDAVRLPLSAAEDRIVGEFMSAFEDLPDHAFPKGRDWVLSELVDTRATWQALQSNIPDEDCTWIHAMPPPTPETDMTIQQVQQSLEELMVLVNHFTHADMPVVALGTLQRICFRLEALIVLNATDEGRATLEEFVRTEVICGPGSVTKAIVDCCACAQSFESVFGLMLLFATFATYAIQAYRSSSNVSGMFVTNIRDMETFRPSDIRDGNHHVPVHMDNAAMGRPKLAIARRAIDVSNEMNQDGAESGRSSRLNASDGESDGVRGVTGVRHVTGCVVAQTVPQVSVELAMRGLDDGEVYHRIIGGEGSSDEMMRSTLSKPDVMEQKRLELVMKKLREMRLDEHDEMAALPRAPSQPAVTVLESASLPITLDTATTVEQGCLERELVGVNAYPTAESDATSTSDDIGTRTPALTEDTASTLTETAGELSDEAGGHVAAEAAASQESTGSAPLSTDLSDVARSGQRSRSTERQQQSAASVVTSEADLSPFQGDRSESLAEARPSIGGGTGWTGIASRSASAEDLTDPIGLVEALHLPPDCAATDEPQDGLGMRKNKSRNLDNRPDPVWSTLGRTGSGPMVETFFHATNQVHTTQPSGRRQMSADSERLIGHIAVRNAEKRQKGLCCGWTCWAK